MSPESGASVVLGGVMLGVVLDPDVAGEVVLDPDVAGGEPDGVPRGRYVW
jgi:hypothetical protein